MNQRNKFKKVSNIQAHIIEKLESYNSTQNLYDNGLRLNQVDFTVKKAQLRVKALINQGQIAHVSTVSANVQKIDSENLYIIVSMENTYEASGSKSLTNEQLATLLCILCSYWVNYQKFKGLKRVFFELASYQQNIEPNVFDNAMRMLQYRKIINVMEILDTSSSRIDKVCVYRSNEEDELIDIAEEVQKQIVVAKIKYPSFVVERPGATLIKFFRKVYYFENSLFSITWVKRDNKNMLAVKRREMDDAYFVFRSGVIEEILEFIKEQMRLATLIKPPIKHFKYFCNEFLRVNLNDALLEDKVRSVDESLGVGETENEFYRLNLALSQIAIESNKREVILKQPIDYFAMDEHVKAEFIEKYGNEFIFHCFKTDNYFWTTMYSKNEKNLWLYPEKHQEIPLKMREDAEEVFKRRRDKALINNIEQIINVLTEIEDTKSLKSNSSAIYSSLKNYIRIAREEFGHQWWDEYRASKKK